MWLIVNQDTPKMVLKFLGSLPLVCWRGFKSQRGGILISYTLICEVVFDCIVFSLYCVGVCKLHLHYLIASSLSICVHNTTHLERLLCKKIHFVNTYIGNYSLRYHCKKSCILKSFLYGIENDVFLVICLCDPPVGLSRGCRCGLRSQSGELLSEFSQFNTLKVLIFARTYFRENFAGTFFREFHEFKIFRIFAVTYFREFCDLAIFLHCVRTI